MEGLGMKKDLEMMIIEFQDLAKEARQQKLQFESELKDLNEKILSVPIANKNWDAMIRLNLELDYQESLFFTSGVGPEEYKFLEAAANLGFQRMEEIIQDQPLKYRTLGQINNWIVYPLVTLLPVLLSGNYQDKFGGMLLKSLFFYCVGIHFNNCYQKSLYVEEQQMEVLAEMELYWSSRFTAMREQMRQLQNLSDQLLQNFGVGDAVTQMYASFERKPSTYQKKR